MVDPERVLPGARVLVRVEVPRRGAPESFSFWAHVPRVPCVGEGLAPEGWADLEVRSVAFVEDRDERDSYFAHVRLAPVESPEWETLRAQIDRPSP